MRILAFVLLTLGAVSAHALPTVEDVQHAVHRGDYAAAESMTRDVLAARPDNAKAHYILAELLAHQGKLGEARAQAATAQQLDPSVHFTTPEKFRQFQALLGGRAAPAAVLPVEKNGTPSGNGDSSLLWIVLLLGAGAVFVILRRRRAAPPGYSGNYPAPPGAAPGAGYAGYPGPAPAPGSGIGGTVAAGLGGLAAGMMAEHLIEEALDHRHHGIDASRPLEQAPTDAIEDRPIDFGNGGDWGGDSAGDAGAFDSGSGSDWS